MLHWKYVGVAFVLNNKKPREWFFSTRVLFLSYLLFLSDYSFSPITTLLCMCCILVATLWNEKSLLPLFVWNGCLSPPRWVVLFVSWRRRLADAFQRLFPRSPERHAVLSESSDLSVTGWAWRALSCEWFRNPMAGARMNMNNRFWACWLLGW